MSPTSFSERPIGRRSVLRGGLGALAASAVAGPLLTACGGDNAGGSSSKELSFWNFYGPADDANPQSKWFVDLAAKWNANNDVKVKLRFIPVKDYVGGTTLQTAFQSGQGPDIFLISPGDFLRYYNGGVLQDLSSVLPADSRCLMQALVLVVLLVRRGVMASLVIGVKAGEPGSSFGAHAWAELGGHPLLPPMADRFARLVDL